MKASTVGALMLAMGLAAAAFSEDLSPPPPPSASGTDIPTLEQSLRAPCERNSDVVMNDSERAGCQIWFFATAGTARFYAYAFPQRLGTYPDWYRVLNSHDRDKRFEKWGLINDPACRPPNDAAESRAHFGFDVCPGDDELLASVGKSDVRYRDPACAYFKDPAPLPGNPHPKEFRQSACDLEFGTSTGVYGLRKFPNPRFNPGRWEQLNNGHTDTWECFNRDSDKTPTCRNPAPLMDGSIEPPFLIGQTCGSCHIAFDPLKPPRDPAHPRVENISGTVGNQYSRVLGIFVSGMKPDTLEYQIYARVNAGTVDTSAIPNDQVNNTGTMNAIMNLARRPTFAHEVLKWRPADPRSPGFPKKVRRWRKAAAAHTDGALDFWCEPDKPNKCWEKGRKTEPAVHAILKGGEDSIGAPEALQRVYINIGACAEPAWLNHFTDLFQLDPQRRGFGQTPFSIGQARRDCPQFRAIEDRLGDLLNYLATGRQADLQAALNLDDRGFQQFLEKEFGAGAVERGRSLFASNCAHCHSSLPEKTHGSFKDRTDLWWRKDETGMRLDWLGNDKPTPAAELHVNYSRALHSNHTAGQLWAEYASPAYHSRPPVELDMPERSAPLEVCRTFLTDGGRGYYRNISLLSVWAFAPFLHDNSVGPEVCGGPEDEFCIDRSKAWLFDPSVMGRFKLFKASMEALLNPTQQPPRRLAIEDARLIGPMGIEIMFPTGKPAAAIGNFRHKDLIRDLRRLLIEPLAAGRKLQPSDWQPIKERLEARFGKACAAEADEPIREFLDRVSHDPTTLLTEAHKLAYLYSTSLDFEENRGDPKGHPNFSNRYSKQDQDDLIAFLATL